jgi:hypothetical protein
MRPKGLYRPTGLNTYTVLGIIEVYDMTMYRIEAVSVSFDTRVIEASDLDEAVRQYMKGRCKFRWSSKNGGKIDAHYPLMPLDQEWQHVATIYEDNVTEKTQEA